MTTKQCEQMLNEAIGQLKLNAIKLPEAEREDQLLAIQDIEQYISWTKKSLRIAVTEWCDEIWGCHYDDCDIEDKLEEIKNKAREA